MKSELDLITEKILIKDFNAHAKEAFTQAGGPIDLSDDIKLSLARNKMRIVYSDMYDGWDAAKIRAEVVYSTLNDLNLAVVVPHKIS
jgi:hypothetical protein